MILEVGLICIGIIIFASVGVLYSWVVALSWTLLIAFLMAVAFGIVTVYEKYKLNKYRRTYDKEKNESRNPKEFRGTRTGIRDPRELRDFTISNEPGSDSEGIGRFKNQEFEPAITNYGEGTGADELDIDEFDNKFNDSDDSTEPGNDGEVGEDLDSSEPDWYTPC